MKFVPVRKVFNTFPHRTAMGEAFARAGESARTAQAKALASRANRDLAFVRSPATSTVLWKEVA